MAHDLNDAELDELDGLLANTPAPLQPMDLSALDGFLCGVMVQPAMIDEAAWLPALFGLEAQPMPEHVDAAWLARCRTLVGRRFEAVNRSLAEDAGFEPLLHGGPSDDAVDDTPPRPLAIWAAGFDEALRCFPSLTKSADDSVAELLGILYRHVPPQTDEEREFIAMLDRERPLSTLDEAIDDLVSAVADLWEMTRPARYAVQTVRRPQAKVGRNDPCPCGSGRKFKLCHGA